jgi:hypothetical protein
LYAQVNAGKYRAEKFCSDDPFVLERAFPSIEQLFESHGEISTANNTVLVVIDTNALLLP